jgi:hypothetical protein
MRQSKEGSQYQKRRDDGVCVHWGVRVDLAGVWRNAKMEPSSLWTATLPGYAHETETRLSGDSTFASLAKKRLPPPMAVEASLAPRVRPGFRQTGRGTKTGC